MVLGVNDLDRLSSNNIGHCGLEYWERESLDEIRNMLANDLYRDSGTINDHLEYLDHLINKIQTLIQQEASFGDSALELKRALAESKSFYNKLSSLLERLA